MIHEDTPTSSANNESPTVGTPIGEQQLSLFDAADFLVVKEAARPASLDDRLDEDAGRAGRAAPRADASAQARATDAEAAERLVMPAYHYDTGVLLEMPRRRSARERRTPLQLAAFISSVELDLVRGEERKTLEIFLEIRAARVRAEFAELTEWQKRRLG